MWKNTCDCGKCDDCNLAMLLSKKNLVAFGADNFNSANDGWVASEDYDYGYDQEFQDLSSNTFDYPLEYSAHVHAYQMHCRRKAGDLYWSERKELWMNADHIDQKAYMDRIRFK